jgi:hypothetical protein
MSIKPIDFNVMLPKTQEVSISKHNENVKNENVVQSQFVIQDKKFQKNKNRVNNTDKTHHSRIDKKKEFKEDTHKNQHKSKKENDDKKEKKESNELGLSIDIRI